MIKETSAANFLSNPDRSAVIQSGSGVIIATENIAGSEGNTVAISAFALQNTNATVANILNATTRVYGRQSGARQNTLRFRRVGHTASNSGT